MPRTGRPKKQYSTPEDELRAAQAADRRAVLVARNKLKKTAEWINADKHQQKILLNQIKNDVQQKRENSGLSGK
jgi:hypothetical protein